MEGYDKGDDDDDEYHRDWVLKRRGTPVPKGVRPTPYVLPPQQRTPRAWVSTPRGFKPKPQRR